MSLASQISILESTGLIDLIGIQPEIEYFFRHALIQEAAYVSLLKAERSELHRTTGEVLEELYPNRREELAARLADHFRQAGDREKALKYYLEAAGHTTRLYANAEAIQSYTHAIKAAEGKPEIQAEIHRARAQIYETMGSFDQARGDLEKALEVADASKDQVGAWRAMTQLGMLWAARDYRKTGEYYLKALEIARAMHDERLLAHSLNSMGNYAINIEDPGASFRNHNEALEIFTRIQDERGVAETSDLLGMAALLSGQFVKAHGWLSSAIAVFEKTGDLKGMASSLATLSFLTTEDQSDIVPSPGFPIEEGVIAAEQALHYSKETGWLSGEVYSLCSLTLCMISLGEYGKALEAIQRGFELINEIKGHQWETFLYNVRGSLFLNLFQFEQAVENYQAGLSLAMRNHSLHWVHTIGGLLASAWIAQGSIAEASALLNELAPPGTPVETLGERLDQAARIELLLAQGQPQQAVDLVEKTIAEEPLYTPDRIIIRYWMLKGRAYLALALQGGGADQKMGYLGEAEHTLVSALQETQAVHSRSREWRIHRLLGEVYAAQGRREQAESARQAALLIIHKLAKSIPVAEYREEFLRKSQSLF